MTSLTTLPDCPFVMRPPVTIARAPRPVSQRTRTKCGDESCRGAVSLDDLLAREDRTEKGNIYVCRYVALRTTRISTYRRRRLRLEKGSVHYNRRLGGHFRRGSIGCCIMWFIYTFAKAPSTITETLSASACASIIGRDSLTALGRMACTCFARSKCLNAMGSSQRHHN